jgi:hypothetical protein
LINTVLFEAFLRILSTPIDRGPQVVHHCIKENPENLEASTGN